MTAIPALPGKLDQRLRSALVNSEGAARAESFIDGRADAAGKAIRMECPVDRSFIVTVSAEAVVDFTFALAAFCVEASLALRAAGRGWAMAIYASISVPVVAPVRANLPNLLAIYDNALIFLNFFL
jgi:hypothetical protein